MHASTAYKILVLKLEWKITLERRRLVFSKVWYVKEFQGLCGRKYCLLVGIKQRKNCRIKMEPHLHLKFIAPFSSSYQELNYYVCELSGSHGGKSEDDSLEGCSGM
jgi:hypothetical protein